MKRKTTVLKHLSYVFVIYCTCSIFGIKPVLAQEIIPALNPSVEIEDMRIIGSAKKDDSFELIVRYKTLIDAQGTIAVVGTYSLYILKNVHNSENFKSAIL